MPDLIVSLSGLRTLDPQLIGGKAANIAAMVNAGFPVPAAFCITTAAYRRQVKETSIGRSLATLVGDPETTPQQLSESIRPSLLAAAIVPDVDVAIREAYRGLGGNVSVAVRSSATSEDSPDASFAGQHDSFLGVHGEHAVLDAVRKCWASLWNTRAVHYRKTQRVPHRSIAMAVVVQSMIPADAAGVMFTLNPVTHSTDELTIAACYGLGEAVVSGLVTPDTFVVDRRSMTVARVSIGTKERQVVQQDQGTTTVAVAADDRRRACISDAIVLEVARLGVAVEQRYGGPQDIEWVAAGGHVYLVQTRPVTTGPAACHAILELPGPAERVYGWFYLGRIPRIARRRFVEMARDHFPHPLRPFDIHTVLVPALAGARQVAGELGIRLPADVARVHTSGLVLFNPPLPAISRTLMRLPRIWRVLKGWADYDPRREWQEIDEPYLRALMPSPLVDELPPDELMRSIDQLQRIVTELMSRRFRKYMAAGAFANRRLDALLRQTVGTRADDMKRRLMLNVGHKTATSNRALRDLALTASRSAAVRDILATRPNGAQYSSLAADPDCQRFVGRLHAFLRQYGYRTAITMEPQPSYPAWRDEPDQVLSLICSLLKQEARLRDEDLDEEQAYREALAEMDGRLQRDPGQRSAFHRNVDVARGFVFAREESLYFLEEIVGLVRIRADRVGAWLVTQGRLTTARHIYHLSPEEVEVALSGSDGDEINEVAARREIAWERMREAWNDGPAVERRGQTSIRGTAVSRGLAVGAARIIHSANDFHKLTAGDILVCPSTTPAWTSLFAIAGAVVADVGGVLSHAAIVAREYGIPAVMGCSDATRTLVDGEPIEVNGTTGIVRRLAPKTTRAV